MSEVTAGRASGAVDAARRRLGSSGSVQHALAILEAYDDATPELGVVELARRLGLPRSTVHRLLQVLQARGFVVQNPATRKYRLGWKLFAIGSLVVRQSNVGEQLRPYALRLAHASGEVVHVDILDAGQVVHVEKAEAPQTVYVRSYVGQRAPAHATAAGKVLLAHLPPDEQAALVREPLRAFTAKTVTDPRALRRDLAAIRAQGYCINPGEWSLEAVGVAAPVRDYSGRVVAALGLVGPASRLTPARLQELAPLVCHHAEAASTHLGAPAARPPRDADESDQAGAAAGGTLPRRVRQETAASRGGGGGRGGRASSRRAG